MSIGKVHSENVGGSGGFKSVGQIQFKDLFDELKWKPVDVARALHVSRSAITMILKGQRKPRSATLEGMRALVERHRAARNHGEEIVKRLNEEESLTDQLRFLRENAPAGYEAAKKTVSVLHDQAVEVILHEKRKPKPRSSGSTADNL